jgi:hypothetical protein
MSKRVEVESRVSRVRVQGKASVGEGGNDLDGVEHSRRMSSRLRSTVYIGICMKISVLHVA